MAVVRLGPDGEVEVLEPANPEEIAAAEGLRRVIAALVRLALAEESRAPEPTRTDTRGGGGT